MQDTSSEESEEEYVHHAQMADAAAAVDDRQILDSMYQCVPFYYLFA